MGKVDNNASFKRISFKQNGYMSKLACLSLGNGKQFKITFVIARQIGDQILQIVKCNQIALCLYLLATKLNMDKPIDIQIRPNKNKY